MAEMVETIEGELVEAEPAAGAGMEWQSAVSEWAEGADMELAGQLRQARAACGVVRRYGRSSMTEFAKEVGCSPTKAYDYARVWFVYGHIFEEGGELSERLQNLGISHLIRALSAPDPVAAIEEAQDSGESVRRMEERIREEEQAKAKGPKNVETVEMLACPKCGEVYAMREARTYTEAAHD